VGVDTSSQPPPNAILSRFAPLLTDLRWNRVSGGFSGATVWRGDDGGTPLLALKAWPPEMTSSRLSQIHAWIRQAAHVSFVPHILPTIEGDPFVFAADAIWDVSCWMPGTPSGSPSIADVETACAAVARLHACWPTSAYGPIPAVLARIRVLEESEQSRVGSGFASLPAELAASLRRGCDAVGRAGPVVERALRPWASASFPLQPCVRDLRGDHILFSESTVTGIVDYGAMGEDHPAADLARLLADFAGDDPERFLAGLRSYRTAGGILAAPDVLVRELARAGLVCSVIGWLHRLRIKQQTPPNAAAIALRVGQLVGQVERF
jgi:Ser/Thr protein kinase RdoA (MazF antagonist)